jgi:hypothetical protein
VEELAGAVDELEHSTDLAFGSVGYGKYRLQWYHTEVPPLRWLGLGFLGLMEMRVYCAY